MFAYPQRVLGRSPAFEHSLVMPRESTAMKHVPSRPYVCTSAFEGMFPTTPIPYCGCTMRILSTLRTKIFDRHKVVFPTVVRRDLVKEVAALPFQVGGSVSDDPLLLAVVRWTVFFLRAFPLLTL